MTHFFNSTQQQELTSSSKQFLPSLFPSKMHPAEVYTKQQRVNIRAVYKLLLEAFSMEINGRNCFEIRCSIQQLIVELKKVLWY